MVYNHIIEHVLCAISPIQFGFIQGRSTIPQLPSFLNFIIHEAISHGHQADSGRLLIWSSIVSYLPNCGMWVVVAACGDGLEAI